MSENDSFVSEVSDALKQERFQNWLRRFGWVIAVVVLGIIAWVVTSEILKARQQAAAAIVGDQINAALSGDFSALDEELSPAPLAIISLIQADHHINENDYDEALAALEVAQLANVSSGWASQIELRKAYLLMQSAPQEARIIFESLNVLGSPVRLLALEGLFTLALEQGDRSEAAQILDEIISDAEITPQLSARLSLYRLMIDSSDFEAAISQELSIRSATEENPALGSSEEIPQ